MWKLLAVPFIFVLIITLTASFGLNVYYYTTATSVSTQLDRAPKWWYTDAGYRYRSSSLEHYLGLRGAAEKAAILLEIIEDAGDRITELDNTIENQRQEVRLARLNVQRVEQEMLRVRKEIESANQTGIWDTLLGFLPYLLVP